MKAFMRIIQNRKFARFRLLTENRLLSAQLSIGTKTASRSITTKSGLLTFIRVLILNIMFPTSEQQAKALSALERAMKAIEEHKRLSAKIEKDVEQFLKESPTYNSSSHDSRTTS